MIRDRHSCYCDAKLDHKRYRPPRIKGNVGEVRLMAYVEKQDWTRYVWKTGVARLAGKVSFSIGDKVCWSPSRSS